MALFVAAWLVGLAPGWAADKLASDWSDADDAKVRLVAAGGGLHDGTYRAVIEIRLAPGWLTYWRNPGDAGVPPTIAFTASDNLATATVGFPPPERIAEAGGEAFGYRTAVDLPVTIVPRDLTRPVRLDLTMDYAICEKICVPAKAHAVLALSPTDPASPNSEQVAAAFAALPVRLSSQAAAQDMRLQPIAGTKNPSWRLDWTDPATVPTDLFIEAPDGWYVTTAPGADPHSFVIAAVERPKGAAGVDVVVTTRGPGGSRELPLHLMTP